MTKIQNCWKKKRLFKKKLYTPFNITNVYIKDTQNKDIFLKNETKSCAGGAGNLIRSTVNEIKSKYENLK